MSEQSKYVLGYDIGTSFVKASLMDESGICVGTVSVPDKEMLIKVKHSGWAEQDPENWWDNLVKATLKLKSKTKFVSNQIAAIGITYQMHGLVLIDKNRQVIRPSIIWCDSRAVTIGNNAFKDLGEEYCLTNYLNSPGNFTASKLRWVIENEPENADKIFKIMLPGDYIAMKMTGEINTTLSGLSEGIFWDFQKNDLAANLLDLYSIDENYIPNIVSTFGEQGRLSTDSAYELGLDKNIPIAYRAGDQPNNAFSLNVLNPGEIAATAGTSGVIYGVGDQAIPDKESRVNTFAHVNHTKNKPRLGTLLCVNGTGIMNSWLRKTLSQKGDLSYEEMNQKAARVSPGANGLRIYPFGNGAERVLGNKTTEAWIEGLNFNVHDSPDIFRAAQEGIVNALNYGFQIMNQMGINASVVRAGDANMFLSPVFREAFVNTTGCALELYDTDGSLGAARGAAIGVGLYSSLEEGFENFKSTSQIEPTKELTTQYQEIYNNWLEILNKKLL